MLSGYGINGEQPQVCQGSVRSCAAVEPGHGPANCREAFSSGLCSCQFNLQSAIGQ